MAKLSYKGYRFLRDKGYDDDIIEKKTGSKIPNVFSRQVQMEKEAEPIDVKRFMPTMYGADITPEMEQEHPYLSAIAKTAREGIATPAFHWANQTLFNTLRALAEKQGYEYPESETVPGKVLSKGAGIKAMFDVPLSYGQKASQYLTRNAPRQIAKLAKNPSISKVARFISRPGVAREAIEGALMGGMVAPAYAPAGDPFNIAKRAATIPVGMAVGAVAQPALAGLGKLFNKVSQSRRPTYTQKASGEKGVPFEQLTPEERIANRKYRAEQSSLSRKQALQKEMRGLQSGDDVLSAELESYKNVVGKEKQQTIAKTTQQISDDIGKAKKDLYNVSQESGIKLKESTTRLSSDFSKTYGAAIDDIGNSLEKSGQSMMRSTADDIIANTIDELTQEGLPITKRITTLKDKYSLEQVDSEGNVTEIIDENVPFREFLNDMKGLVKKQGKQVFEGSKARTEEQLSDLILKRKFGDYIATVSDDFKPLQKESSDIIEGVKFLRRKTKPFSKYATKEPTSFVEGYAKGVASGKEDIGTSKAIRLAEEGTTLRGKPIKGAGKITEKPIEQARLIERLTSKKEKSPTAISRLYDDEMSRIESAISSTKSRSAGKKSVSESVKSKIQNEIDVIEQQLIKRKNEIERGLAGKQRYSVLKRRLQFIKNLIGYSAIGAGSTYGGVRTFGRIYRQ